MYFCNLLVFVLTLVGCLLNMNTLWFYFVCLLTPIVAKVSKTLVQESFDKS